MSPMRFIRCEVFRLTQAEMAAIAGVNQSTVSNWEKGAFEPNRDEMARIREEAIRRRLKWQDRWFFSAPAVDLPQAAPDAA